MTEISWNTDTSTLPLPSAARSDNVAVCRWNSVALDETTVYKSPPVLRWHACPRNLNEINEYRRAIRVSFRRLPTVFNSFERVLAEIFMCGINSPRCSCRKRMHGGHYLCIFCGNVFTVSNFSCGKWWIIL